MEFCNVHCHSAYSLRDSITKIPDLIKRAKELGAPAVALSDHGSGAGLMELYTNARDNDLKPIMGVEAYMATRGRTDKVPKVDKYYHITLIAMNNTGWRNLTKLISESYDPENFYYKPRIDRELLRKYNAGLICLSGCIGGNLSNAILRNLNIDFTDESGNDTHIAECADHIHAVEETTILNESYMSVVDWHRSVFGDRFYLEVQNHNMPQDQKLLDVIFDIADRTKIKVVATTDSHFTHAEDEKAHDIMLAIRDRITINDEKMAQIKYPGNGYHMLSYEEISARFPGRSDAIKNTMEIVDRCKVSFEKGSFRIPHLHDKLKEDDVFVNLVWEGLNKRFNNNIPPEAKIRAQEEIDTIIQMTFPSYFLVVSDYIRWAKKNNILVGPGRGSAAGSIVSYALDITDVNPLDYDLSFARFLNSGRCAIPQIDFKDFPIAEWMIKKQQNQTLAI